jgi:hypothetical protein
MCMRIYYATLRNTTLHYTILHYTTLHPPCVEPVVPLKVLIEDFKPVWAFKVSVRLALEQAGFGQSVCVCVCVCV